MFCSKCGNQNGEGVNFCRRCGTDLESMALASLKYDFLNRKNTGENLMNAKSKDPDELTGKGIGNVIIGDGFLMVAAILSVAQSSVSGLFWLLLLIPAFFFFGKGFADILHAKQIRRRTKQNNLNNAPQIAELPPPSVSFVDTVKKHISGELVPVPSVTEKTTRDLN
jgi:zinc-ribbon domain